MLTFPLQWLSAVRRWLYRAGVLRAYHAARPVVSVGNLGFGGSGKTPVVLALARALAQRGIRVAILTRGYGGSARGTTLVQPHDDPAVVGDEPLLLARKSGVAVIVDRRRARAAAWATSAVAPDLFLLDDGFSHLQLARDLDWVMLAEKDLELASPRRELRGALRHAGIVATLEKVPPGATAVALQLQVNGAAVANKRVVAVAAIAHPERFERSLKQAGATVVSTRFFRDHRPLPASAFSDLPAHDLVVITEKDAVKMSALPPRCTVLESEITLPAALVDRVVALVRR